MQGDLPAWSRDIKKEIDVTLQSICVANTSIKSLESNIRAYDEVLKIETKNMNAAALASRGWDYNTRTGPFINKHVILLLVEGYYLNMTQGLPAGFVEIGAGGKEYRLQQFPMIPWYVIENKESWSSGTTAKGRLSVHKYPTYTDEVLANVDLRQPYATDDEKGLCFNVLKIAGIDSHLISICERLAKERKLKDFNWNTYKRDYVYKGLSKIKIINAKDDLRCLDPNVIEPLLLSKKHRVYVEDGGVRHLKTFKNPDTVARENNAYVRLRDPQQLSVFEGHERRWNCDKDDRFVRKPSIHEIKTYTQKCFIERMYLNGGGYMGKTHLDAATKRVIYTHGNSFTYNKSRRKDLWEFEKPENKLINSFKYQDLGDDSAAWYKAYGGEQCSMYPRQLYDSYNAAIKWNLDNDAPPRPSQRLTMTQASKNQDKASISEHKKKIIALDKKHTLLTIQYNEALIKEKVLASDIVNNTTGFNPLELGDRKWEETPQTYKKWESIYDDPKYKWMKKSHTEDPIHSLGGSPTGPLPIGGGTGYTWEEHYSSDKPSLYILDIPPLDEYGATQKYEDLIKTFPEESKRITMFKAKHDSIKDTLNSLVPIPLDIFGKEEIKTFDQVIGGDTKGEYQAEEEDDDERDPREDLSTDPQTIMKGMEEVIANEPWEHNALQYQYSPEKRERPIEKSSWRVVYVPLHISSWLTFLTSKHDPMSDNTSFKTPIERKEREQELIEFMVRNGKTQDEAMGVLKNYANIEYRAFPNTHSIEYRKGTIFFLNKINKEIAVLKCGGYTPPYKFLPEFLYGRRHPMVMEYLEADYDRREKRKPHRVAPYINKKFKTVDIQQFFLFSEDILYIKDSVANFEKGWRMSHIFKRGGVQRIHEDAFLYLHPLNVPFSGIYNNFNTMLSFGEAVLASKFLQQVYNYEQYHHITGDERCDLFDNSELCDLQAPETD